MITGSQFYYTTMGIGIIALVCAASCAYVSRRLNDTPDEQRGLIFRWLGKRWPLFINEAYVCWTNITGLLFTAYLVLITIKWLFMK